MSRCLSSAVVVVVVLVELMRRLVEALVVAVVAVVGKIGAFFVPLMFLRRHCVNWVVWRWWRIRHHT